jgi:hypothetical protein
MLTLHAPRSTINPEPRADWLARLAARDQAEARVGTIVEVYAALAAAGFYPIYRSADEFSVIIAGRQMVCGPDTTLTGGRPVPIRRHRDARLAGKEGGDVAPE